MLTLSPASARAADPNDRTIYEIQYTPDPDGASPLDGQLINCIGGVVVHKFERSVPRLVLQDPNHPDGWGAIQIKDRYNITSYFDGIAVGDWVRVDNIKIEEYRGTTFAQLYQVFNPVLTVVSSGHPVPAALTVDPNDIAAPLPDAGGDYYVVDHSAEKYECMLLRVENVVVEQLGLGKASDNYALASGDYPGQSCWAADYYNQDRGYFDTYCELIALQRKFCAVEGMLEQYTNLAGGFDYYQLMTTKIEDFDLPLAGDISDSCTVGLTDFGLLAGRWLDGPCGLANNWCEYTDINQDTNVDVADLVYVAQDWLR